LGELSGLGLFSHLLDALKHLGVGDLRSHTLCI
jgi:hypothetical protein